MAFRAANLAGTRGCRSRPSSPPARGAYPARVDREYDAIWRSRSMFSMSSGTSRIRRRPRRGCAPRRRSTRMAAARASSRRRSRGRWACRSATTRRTPFSTGSLCCPSACRVRIALERGRLRNSGGDPAAAVPLLPAPPADRRRVASPPTSCSCRWMRCTCSRSPMPPHAAAVDRARAARARRRRRRSRHSGGASGCTTTRVGAASTPRTSRRPIAEFELAKDAAVRWGTPQQVAWADEALDEARALR